MTTGGHFDFEMVVVTVARTVLVFLMTEVVVSVAVTFLVLETTAVEVEVAETRARY